MPDWGDGCYEVTAAEIEPVAERVVAMAAPLRTESFLDIACGTGNAAILAARFRSAVTGLDQAPRLVQVAKDRAAQEGLVAGFLVGDAQNLPFPDRSFDVAVSVFGLIFAADPERAFSEMIRVLRPGGRAFFTVWLPGGAIDAMVSLITRYVQDATGQAGPPSRLEWHVRAVVEDLASRHLARAAFHDGELQFFAESPEAFFLRNKNNHPMSVGVAPLLERAGTAQALQDDVLRVLREGNQNPDAFAVTSRYRVVEIRR